MKKHMAIPPTTAPNSTIMPIILKIPKEALAAPVIDKF